KLARVADVHWIPLASFDSLRDVLAAERRLNDILDVLDRESVARDGMAVDANVGKVPLRDALGVDTAGAGHLLDDALDLLSEPLNDIQVCTENLDADRRFDARQQHVQTISNRLRPDVRE